MIGTSTNRAMSLIWLESSLVKSGLLPSQDVRNRFVARGSPVRKSRTHSSRAALQFFSPPPEKPERDQDTSQEVGGFGNRGECQDPVRP